MGIGVDAVWGFELDLNSPLSDPAAGCDDAASARARFILGTYNGSNSIILSVDIKKLILFLNSSIHPATVEQDSVLPQRWAQEIPRCPAIARPQVPQRGKATSTLRPCRDVPPSPHYRKYDDSTEPTLSPLACLVAMHLTRCRRCPQLGAERRRYRRERQRESGSIRFQHDQYSAVRQYLKT